MGRHKAALTDREERMRAMYLDGKTLAEIGVDFHLTRERVRQLLTKHYGLKREHGGQSRRVMLRTFEMVHEQISRKAGMERKAEALCGCSIDVIYSLSGGMLPYAAKKAATNTPTPVAYWLQQRMNAKQRGIGWELPLAEWWRIWQESGHWHERGRGPGYAMARLGDCGPYAVGNVEIITMAQNTADSYIVKPAAARAILARETRARTRASKNGEPDGR